MEKIILSSDFEVVINDKKIIELVFDVENSIKLSKSAVEKIILEFSHKYKKLPKRKEYKLKNK